MFKVFINPGHAPNGEPDPGAVNEVLGLKESQVVWEIGLQLKEILEHACCEVEILQSHNLCGESQGPEVCRSANDSGADVFISLHCNAFNGQARGAETLCHMGGTKAEELSAYIQNQLVRQLRLSDTEFPDRGIKYRPDLAVLRYTTMPAVLVEIGFIDNEDDAYLLTTHQFSIAAAIARGITDYWCQVG